MTTCANACTVPTTQVDHTEFFHGGMRWGLCRRVCAFRAGPKLLRTRTFAELETKLQHTFELLDQMGNGTVDASTLTTALQVHGGGVIRRAWSMGSGCPLLVEIGPTICDHDHRSTHSLTHSLTHGCVAGKRVHQRRPVHTQRHQAVRGQAGHGLHGGGRGAAQGVGLGRRAG